MNYILVVFNTSVSLECHDRKRLTSIVTKLEEIANNVGAEILAENCFLLPMETGLEALCDLKSTAEEAGLKYKAVFLTRPPESTTFQASSVSSGQSNN